MAPDSTNSVVYVSVDRHVLLDRAGGIKDLNTFKKFSIPAYPVPIVIRFSSVLVNAKYYSFLVENKEL